MSHPFYFTWSKQKDAINFPIEKASGNYVYSDGNKVFDFTSSSYQASFGYSQEKIVEGINNQLKTLPIASSKSIFDLKSSSTNELMKYMQKDNGKVFYTVSGAESIENALKMARQVSGKKIILARTPSYHGATLGALSITGDWRNGEHETIDEWVRRIPEPSEDPTFQKTRLLIEAVGADKIAAFCLETITGNNGVYSQDQTWWDEVQKACKDYNILLILDEVICGFGRTGKPFGFDHYNIDPDFICLAKGITGGFIPFGAVWTNQKIADYYEENILSCGLTNYAHPLGLSAMKGVLDLLKDTGFHNNYNESLHIFTDQLNTLSKNDLGITEIRQKGFLAAIEFKNEIPNFNDFLKEGLYLIAQKKRLILAPPLTSSKEELLEGFTKLNKVLGIKNA